MLATATPRLERSNTVTQANEKTDTMLPYWQVNVSLSDRVTECPIFLQNLSPKDKSILSTKDEDYHIQTWSEVKEIVASHRLDAFQRVPSNLRRYLCYIHHLRQTYGSVLNFMLMYRLGWNEPVTPRGTKPFQDASDVKVLLNDWPYGVDKRIVHLVVWSKFELKGDEETELMTEETRCLIHDYVDRTFCGAIPPENVSLLLAHVFPLPPTSRTQISI